VRGAALFAAVSLGYVQAHEVRGLVPVAGRYEPDPATKATYDRVYAEYPGLYRRLKGVHRRWNGVKNR
jgi:xylulokinase